MTTLVYKGPTSTQFLRLLVVPVSYLSSPCVMIKSQTLHEAFWAHDGEHVSGVGSLGYGSFRAHTEGCETCPGRCASRARGLPISRSRRRLSNFFSPLGSGAFCDGASFIPPLQLKKKHSTALTHTSRWTSRPMCLGLIQLWVMGGSNFDFIGVW